MNSPRLRCHEKGENYFYGSYRGHSVSVLRDSPERAWAFLVQCPDGTYAADGLMDRKASMREAIIHAITGAEGLNRSRELSRDEVEKISKPRKQP